MDIQKMSSVLEKELSPERYCHSVNVMKECVRLAKIFSVDEEKARIAGLLHDCGRAVKKKDSAAKAEEIGIKVLPIEVRQPILLHAPLGVHIAREQYGIKDSEILSAIALHTTGGPNMAPLDMVVFVADMIEPGRTQPGVELVRSLAVKSLELAMLASLESTISYLLQKRLLIHPVCIDCWNDLLLKREQGVS